MTVPSAMSTTTATSSAALNSSEISEESLSEKTSVFGLRRWVIVGIGIGAFVVLLLFFLSLWLSFHKKQSQKGRRRRRGGEDALSPPVIIPTITKEITEVQINHHQPHPYQHYLRRPPLLSQSESSGEQKEVFHARRGELGGVTTENTKRRLESYEKEEEKEIYESQSSSHNNALFSRSNNSLQSPPPPHANLEVTVSSSSVPEVSHLGWGHWYTLRELETATNSFSDSNVLGEGSYGIVYRGQIPDSSFIAVKNLLNNRGQAEKEFKVEVEAIGRVRHKNLVRLLGYCAEGSHRMLVYEYVDNGNLSQSLHGPLAEKNPLPWDVRMKILLGTAKGLAYLHEGLEPKVVHRDVKASNILLDHSWNAKLSDFGLAKLLGSGRSHVTTRVMGTFGYVAPEYANTGLLNERNDVYSFGVLLMEVITGRDPVDYGRPVGEVNLVDWLKMMVGSRRSDEVADPKIEVKPSPRALKRALLVALRCVDPDSQKRPKMGHVVHMLESDDDPFQNDRKFSRHSPGSREESSHHHRQISASHSPRALRDSPSPGTGKGLQKPEIENEDYKPRWKRYEA